MLSTSTIWLAVLLALSIVGLAILIALSPKGKRQENALAAGITLLATFSGVFAAQYLAERTNRNIDMEVINSVEHSSLQDLWHRYDNLSFHVFVGSDKSGRFSAGMAKALYARFAVSDSVILSHLLDGIFSRPEDSHVVQLAADQYFGVKDSVKRSFSNGTNLSDDVEQLANLRDMTGGFFHAVCQDLAAHGSHLSNSDMNFEAIDSERTGCDLKPFSEPNAKFVQDFLKSYETQ